MSRPQAADYSRALADMYARHPEKAVACRRCSAPWCHASPPHVEDLVTTKPAPNFNGTTPADYAPAVSTQTTPAGVQILAPWAASQMDTATPLRTPATAPERPLPLFTQDEDRDARALAASQLSLFA